MTPTRRLLFWLWTPYVSDVVMVIVGIWMLVRGDSTGWLPVIFAAVRALLGTIALLLAYRMISPTARLSRHDPAQSGHRYQHL